MLSEHHGGQAGHWQSNPGLALSANGGAATASRNYSYGCISRQKGAGQRHPLKQLISSSCNSLQ